MLKPAGHTIPDAYLERAAQMHPHGFGLGWVYPESGQLHLWRSVRDAKAWRHRVAALKGAVVIAHARYATHGPKVKANCHPAWLGEPGQALVGHNGVLRSVPDCKAGRSDSRVFIDHVLGHLKAGWQQDAVLRGQLEHLIGSGNKLVVLNADASYTILNERIGHWKDGVWYSNDSYLPYEAKPKYSRGGVTVYGGRTTVATEYDDMDEYYMDRYPELYGERATVRTTQEDDPTVRGVLAASAAACASNSCDLGVAGEVDDLEDLDEGMSLYHVWCEQKYYGIACDQCLEDMERQAEMAEDDTTLQTADLTEEEWHGEEPQCDFCGATFLRDDEVSHA
jgi:hypothetical protein